METKPQKSFFKKASNVIAICAVLWVPVSIYLIAAPPPPAACRIPDTTEVINGPGDQDKIKELVQNYHRFYETTYFTKDPRDPSRFIPVDPKSIDVVGTIDKDIVCNLYNNIMGGSKVYYVFARDRSGQDQLLFLNENYNSPSFDKFISCPPYCPISCSDPDLAALITYIGL